MCVLDSSLCDAPLRQHNQKGLTDFTVHHWPRSFRDRLASSVIVFAKMIVAYVPKCKGLYTSLDCESIKDTSVGVLLEKSRTPTEMFDVALTELMSRMTLSITSCSSPLTRVQKASGGGSADHAWQERDRASVCTADLSTGAPSVTIRSTFSEDR